MAKKIKTIGEAVPALLTYLIAETAIGKERLEPTKELVNGLVAKANFHFNTNEQFKKSILSKANGGNAGRDNLYMWMEHWIKGKYWIRHGYLPEALIPYQEDLSELSYE